MLRNIPREISPELMKILMEMGHSDTIVLTDANFPVASHNARTLRLEGVEIDHLLDAVMGHFPLDDYIESPVTLMRPRAHEATPEIWANFEESIRKGDVENTFKEFRLVERPQFYEETKQAYAVVQCATTMRYANVILQKGVL